MRNDYLTEEGNRYVREKDEDENDGDVKEYSIIDEEKVYMLSFIKKSKIENK